MCGDRGYGERDPHQDCRNAETAEAGFCITGRILLLPCRTGGSGRDGALPLYDISQMGKEDATLDGSDTIYLVSYGHRRFADMPSYGRSQTCQRGNRDQTEQAGSSQASVRCGSPPPCASGDVCNWLSYGAVGNPVRRMWESALCFSMCCGQGFPWRNCHLCISHGAQSILPEKMIVLSCSLSGWAASVVRARGFMRWSGSQKKEVTMTHWMRLQKNTIRQSPCS